LPGEKTLALGPTTEFSDRLLGVRIGFDADQMREGAHKHMPIANGRGGTTGFVQVICRPPPPRPQAWTIRPPARTGELTTRAGRMDFTKKKFPCVRRERRGKRDTQGNCEIIIPPQQITVNKSFQKIHLLSSPFSAFILPPAPGFHDPRVFFNH